MHEGGIVPMLQTKAKRWFVSTLEQIFSVGSSQHKTWEAHTIGLSALWNIEWQTIACSNLNEFLIESVWCCWCCKAIQCVFWEEKKNMALFECQKRWWASPCFWNVLVCFIDDNLTMMASFWQCWKCHFWIVAGNERKNREIRHVCLICWATQTTEWDQTRSPIFFFRKQNQFQWERFHCASSRKASTTDKQEATLSSAKKWTSPDKCQRWQMSHWQFFHIQ